jgi:C4-dicarboxylate transporter, DctQ subunit
LKRPISTISAIFDRILDITFVLVSVLIFFIMLFVSLEIVSRVILGKSIYGVVDLTEIALLWITFLGAAWVLKRDKHVKIEVIIGRFSTRARIRFGIIT